MAQTKVLQRQSHILLPPPLLARSRFLYQRILWPYPTCASVGTLQPSAHDSSQILRSVTLLLCMPRASDSSTGFSASRWAEECKAQQHVSQHLHLLQLDVWWKWLGCAEENRTLQLGVSLGLCGDAWKCSTQNLCALQVCSLLLPC